MVLALVVLVAMGAVTLLVWDFRRKAAAREAASKQRFDEMFRARTAVPAAPVASPAGTVPSVAAPEATAPVAGTRGTAADRFLGPRETLLYRLLKAGIPDHEIFANVALASVAGGRSDQELRRIAQYRLDFVVCDKAMRLVAAIEIDSTTRTRAPGEAQFVADVLKTAGLKLVRLDPMAPPRREAIRELVCGPAGHAAA